LLEHRLGFGEPTLVTGYGRIVELLDSEARAYGTQLRLFRFGGPSETAERRGGELKGTRLWPGTEERLGLLQSNRRVLREQPVTVEQSFLIASAAGLNGLRGIAASHMKFPEIRLGRY